MSVRTARRGAVASARLRLVAAAAQVVWEDTFTTLDLATSATASTARWRPVDRWQPIDVGYQDFGAGGTTWNLNPNHVLAGAARSPFRVEDGVLTVQAEPTPAAWGADIAAANTDNGGAVPPNVGGILITNPAVRTFGYGYYEWHAAMPGNTKGTFPALWMYAAHDSNPGLNKGGAEIDIMEVFGRATGRPYAMSVHTRGDNDGDTQVDLPTTVGTADRDTRGWHVYAVDWTADHLRYYFDGELVASAAPALVEWLRGVRMDLRVNIAREADWFVGDQLADETTSVPLVLAVDFIRVWDRKPTHVQPAAPAIPTVPSHAAPAAAATFDSSAFDAASFDAA